jgi:GT2 family glycosyltransferase
LRATSAQNPRVSRQRRPRSSSPRRLLLLRKEVWEEWRFDESFAPAWFEDVDFCKRVAARGWELRYFPDLQAVHHGGLALETMPYSSFLRTYYGNLLKYFRKHHPTRYAMLWLPVKVGAWARLALRPK